MTTRRGFFSKMAGALGIIALAPQLAFRVPVLRFTTAPMNFEEWVCRPPSDMNQPLPSFWYTPTIDSARMSREYKEVFEKTIRGLS